MQLAGNDVEAAFIEAAREQEGGPFNWDRVAFLLNERIADRRDQRRGGSPGFLLVPTVGSAR
jgi:hypothetical protein